MEGPNIVFIFVDDLGYGDLGCYGNLLIDTPNIDRLATEGVKFTEFYSGSSICTPSRASLLTGRYPSRADLGPYWVYWPFSIDGLSPSEITIAELLKERGYATAIVGKWHLGHLPAYLPMAQGFDYFYGIPYSNDMTPGHPVFPWLPELPLMENEEVVEVPADQSTLTQRYTQQVIQFMQDSVADGFPFFIYYANNFPHIPLYRSDDFVGVSDGGIFGDVVEEIDWSVGEILDELVNLGVEDRTLVVFTSDNGPWIQFPNGGSAGVLTGGKATSFEGGFRVPLVARWPELIPAGLLVDQPAAMVDWLPTLAVLAKAPLPADRVLDGNDISRVLMGSGARDPSGVFRYLFLRPDSHDVGAYREGPWKLKVSGGSMGYAMDTLFDLEVSPQEELEDDLAALYPEELDRLWIGLLDLEAEIVPLLLDGFESGGTSSWSDTVVSDQIVSDER